MAENKEKKMAEKTLAEVSQNVDLIRQLSVDKNLKKTLNSFNVKFSTAEAEKPLKSEKILSEEEKQKALAESYYKQIDGYLNTLDSFTLENKKSLDNQMNYATIAAGLLPLFLTLLSGGLFVVSANLLSFITNAFSVIPPLIINSIKGKIDGYYKGAQLKTALIGMKYSIERLVTIMQLNDEARKSIEEQLKLIASELNKP